MKRPPLSLVAPPGVMQGRPPRNSAIAAFTRSGRFRRVQGAAPSIIAIQRGCRKRVFHPDERFAAPDQASALHWSLRRGFDRAQY